MKTSRFSQLATLLFWAAPAVAQVVPVDSAGFNWPVFIGVAVVLVLVVAFVLWKRRATPAEEAEALSEARRAAATVAAEAIAALRAAQGHIADLIAKLPKTPTGATGPASGTGMPPAPGQNAVAVDPTPVPGIQAATAAQLAAIEHARESYNQARAAAGLPPI